MKKEEKKDFKISGLTLLVSVVIILVIALIGFNLQNITSYNVSDIKTDTTIRVYPNSEEKSIIAGEYINVEVFPGSRCVDRRAYIDYTKGGGIKATLQPAGTSLEKLCNPFTLTYKTLSEWEENPGVYYVKVFDFGTKDFVVDTFTIKEKE